MDWAGRTEGRGNAGETADSFFHPSGPSRPGNLIQRKSLILQPELVRGGGRPPFHPGNPGLDVLNDSFRDLTKEKLKSEIINQACQMNESHLLLSS